MERAVETLRRLTAEGYELLPDDGQRHEIVDGEHVVTPSPGVQHQRVARRGPAPRQVPEARPSTRAAPAAPPGGG